jgi:hypothetical protein
MNTHHKQCSIAKAHPEEEVFTRLLQDGQMTVWTARFIQVVPNTLLGTPPSMGDDKQE